MTTYRLSCGHTFEADNVDHELRDRILCAACFDTGAPAYRSYIVEIRP